MKLALAVAVLVSVCGCQRKSACEGNGGVAHVAAGHEHEAAIPADHVKRGIGGSYPLKRPADHEHVITLSDADMKTFAEQGRVTITATSVKGHTHSVEIHCRE